MSPITQRLSAVSFLAFAVVAGFQPALEAAPRCVTARISEPFLLPDGTARRAGTLSLCAERAFSPVSTAFELRVDGFPVGLYASRQVLTEEAEPIGSFVVLRREANGVPRLVGYAVPSAEHTGLHVFQTPAVTVEVGRFLLRVAAGGHADGSVVSALAS